MGRCARRVVFFSVLLLPALLSPLSPCPFFFSFPPPLLRTRTNNQQNQQPPNQNHNQVEVAVASEDNRKSEVVTEIVDLKDKVSKSKRGVWRRFWNSNTREWRGKEESSYFAIFLNLVVYVVLDLSFFFITFVVLMHVVVYVEKKKKEQTSYAHSSSLYFSFLGRPS